MSPIKEQGDKNETLTIQLHMERGRLLESLVVTGLSNTFNFEKDMFKSREEGHTAKDEYKD